MGTRASASLEARRRLEARLGENRAAAGLLHLKLLKAGHAECLLVFFKA